MTTPEQTFTSKLGTTRAGPRTRVWLEGKRLLDHGFTHGTLIERQWDAAKHRLVLRVIPAALFETLHRDNRGTVAGSAARPIIDIASTLVSSTFKGDHVTVTYSAGQITITG